MGWGRTSCSEKRFEKEGDRKEDGERRGGRECGQRSRGGREAERKAEKVEGETEERGSVFRDASTCHPESRVARGPDLPTELGGGTCGQAVARGRRTRGWSGLGTQGEQGHTAGGNEHILAWTGRQMCPQPFQHCLRHPRCAPPPLEGRVSAHEA